MRSFIAHEWGNKDPIEPRRGSRNQKTQSKSEGAVEARRGTSNQKGHGFSRAINPRAMRASALPKAVVKPEGRNDRIAFARITANPSLGLYPHRLAGFLAPISPKTSLSSPQTTHLAENKQQNSCRSITPVPLEWN
jgi:hypothetical protein